nr:uncharacterized protein LOC111423039 [Onthophagus taurus]
METKTLKATLKSGRKMPIVGFGTYQIRGTSLIRDVLDYALGAGYRSIDTAAVYGNETDIGSALKTLLPKYNLKREDIFITTKLSPSDHGEKALDAVKQSLKNLDCGYLDLYLVHWPGQSRLSIHDPSNIAIRAKTWEKLIEAKKQGLVKDIGVSNYTIKHLEELDKSNSEIPAVNQVEWHPFYHQSDLKNYCKQKGILLQAYSSLGGTNNPDLMTNEVVVEIAKNLNKSPSQVLLKWAVQQGVGIIPKARSKSHIEENINLDFEIPEKDLDKLNNIGTMTKFAWDPTDVA